MYSIVQRASHPPIPQKTAIPHTHRLGANGANRSPVAPTWTISVPPRPSLADLAGVGNGIPSQVVQAFDELLPVVLALGLADHELKRGDRTA